MQKIPSIVQNFLQDKALMSLATSNADGEVHNAFVYYFYDSKTNEFFITTRSVSGKLKDITEHPQIACAIVDQDNLITVQLRGDASAVTANSEIHSLIETLSKIANSQNSRAFPPIIKLTGGVLKLVRIRLTWYKYSNFMPTPPLIMKGEI